MNYEDLVEESIVFFESAKKRITDKLEKVERQSTKLQLEKELEIFLKLKGFWDQEKRRIEMMRKYSINYDKSV